MTTALVVLAPAPPPSYHHHDHYSPRHLHKYGNTDGSGPQSYILYQLILAAHIKCNCSKNQSLLLIYSDKLKEEDIYDLPNLLFQSGEEAGKLGHIIGGTDGNIASNITTFHHCHNSHNITLQCSIMFKIWETSAED